MIEDLYVLGFCQQEKWAMLLSGLMPSWMVMVLTLGHAQGGLLSANART